MTDLVKRGHIVKVGSGPATAYVTANIDTTFSATAISKYLKSKGRSVSAETVLNYIKACTDAFLFYQMKRQDLQRKKILTVNEKYYVADHDVRDNFPKYVVTLDEFDMSRDGMKHRNFRNFLLAEEWN